MWVTARISVFQEFLLVLVLLYFPPGKISMYLIGFVRIVFIVCAKYVDVDSPRDQKFMLGSSS